MDNKKIVQFGTKQEAIITPKEGYEVEAVEVVNTADNSVIPSELRQDNEVPTQWFCSFIQPAAHVLIKPVIRPIEYTVSFEVSDVCTVVLVETNSNADVMIKTAVNEHEDTDNANNEKSDFSEPQHSVNEGADNALDVGDKDGKESEGYAAVVEADGASGLTQEVVVSETQEDGSDEENDNTPSKEDNNDVAYDAGEYASELEESEPVCITQAEADKKNTLFWRWKEEFDAGKCSEEKFETIKKKHLKWLDDINEGKIVVEGQR